MSTLESLIRLHRWQVDERRRHVNELEGLSEKLQLELARLAEERRAEEVAATASFDAQRAYPGYIRRALERQETLERSLAEIEAQILQARDALAAAFQELKRYEIASANRERHRLHAEHRRERIETDAIALENFRRKAGGM